MKTVVITGSARGLGFEMAKVFRRNNVNVVISDLNLANINNAKAELEKIKSRAKVHACVCDVTKLKDIESLITETKSNFGVIDIWINNAGINQPDKAIWELSESAIDAILQVDLKGTILCSKLAMEEMIKQKKGAIYNVEGHGSNDAKILGLSLYGTSKRAITYFTEALAKESEEKNTNVIIGKLSPGIMITDFIQNALGSKEKIDLPEKTKNVYNILGDYPNVVAEFLVKGILNNTKNNAKINWLTTRKVMGKFISSMFKKRDFFNK